jgi:hypothetical protein
MEFLTTLLATPEQTLGVAVLIASLSGIGWVIAHAVTVRNERRRQQLIWQLDFTARQLEKLYGPLAFMIIEGEQAFADLLRRLGRNYVFQKGRTLPEEELKTWLFWAESDLMPRNRRIQKLLESHPHLIEGEKMPHSYVEFLKHHSSWEIAHRRWKEQQVEYSWHSEVNWPKDFQVDVLDEFRKIKERHAALLGQLGKPG